MLDKKRFSIVLMVLIYVILIMDILAFRFFLYWRFWWFDIVMHFLGGIWIMLVSYYIFYLSDYAEYVRHLSKKYSPFILSLSSIAFVGIFWELFELTTKVSIQSNYVLDTSLDLFMDMSGWIVAYTYVEKRTRKR
ncbi:MAG: hypothetical protein V1851_01440 [Patescibacteria group bacterium]